MATFDIDGFVSWFIITGTRTESGTFDEERFMEAVRATVVRGALGSLGTSCRLGIWLDVVTGQHRQCLRSSPQIPHMSPYPGPRSVLVLDNASILPSTTRRGSPP